MFGDLETRMLVDLGCISEDLKMVVALMEEVCFGKRMAVKLAMGVNQMILGEVPDLKKEVLSLALMLDVMFVNWKYFCLHVCLERERSLQWQKNLGL